LAGGWRALAALALVLSVVTCRDALGPRGTGAGQGHVAFAPILPSEVALASFGLAIDQVRIIVVRPAADTLADTTVALPPDSSSLDLDIHVSLLSSPETLSVSIIALSGTTPLFQGTSNVEVTSGSGTPTPTEIPVDTYVGPGAGVDSIVVLPAAPFIYVNDSLRFQVQAFDSSGAPLTQFYVSWSTSDSTIARVNGFGVLRAPGTRSSVRVRARTPGGVADSVTVTFQPLPTQLLNIAGGGQLAAPGQPLGTQLEVEVRASDNLSVSGVGVRFRSLSGGAPADTTVTSGVDGRAKVTGVLGAIPGAQSFQATVPAFPAITPVTFTATAVGTISAATSTISTSAGSVASGAAVTLTLQGKDAAGNNITTGGATVAFNFSGGSSTGTIGATTDNGNGTYTATFTGVIAGAATTIGATINAAPVASTLPTVSVTPGTISAGTSLLSVSSDTIAAGGTATLGLQARDAAGNNLTTGGATVAFTVSGGTSGGSVGSTTDHGNGTYTAIFTAQSAGTPATIGATIGASPVTTALPSITVTAGAASPATSVLSVSGATVASGNGVVLRLQAKDASGNNVTSGGAAVVFSHSGGASTGVISATADSGNGVYTATFTGVIAGTATTIGATINGSAVLTAAPTIVVTPGVISGATSVVTASTDTVLSGAVATLHLRAKDAAGNLRTTGGDTVVFTASGGSSSGSISAAADSGNGVYTATFTGLAAGTATTISATVNGGAVTTVLPVLTVIPGAASHLVFAVQPSPSFVGSAIAPAIEVTARDPFGNTTPAFTGAVTVAIGTNPGTGTLTGTLSHNAIAGVATFNDLQIDQPGIGYTLTASASGLTSATSATFDMITAAGTIAWANVAGGNWSNPANWNGGVVPGPTDIALISLPGTYTVTFDVSDTVGGLQLGGSSGTQTLAIASRTLGLAAGSQVNANGVVSLSSATLNGPGSITNTGQVFVQGTTALNGAVATAATSMIRVQGNAAFGGGNMTVASGFVNNGTIILTDSTSSYGASLHVTTGSLTNSAGAVIDVRVGATGPRTLDVALDNQGTLTVNHPLGLTKSSAVHTNSGTINVNAKLTIQQSGGSPSFTNVGSITIGSTDTLAVTGGAFAYSGGTISGGAWTIASAAVSASQSFSTATSVLKLTNSTWGGAGTLTVAPSTALTLGSTTVTSPLVNQGALTVNGASVFNGAVTNAAGATLRMQGNAAFGTATLTLANGFTNNGTIILTDSTSSYGSVLAIATGALDNAAGATIVADVGTLGTRSLNALLQNSGTLTINQPLTLNKASAAHSNGGTINVGARFTILQTGTLPSFTHSGAINIASGDTVAVSGGTFAYAAGTIAGPGALALSSTTVDLTQDLSTATVPFSLASATVGGTGTVTVAPSTFLRVRSSTINTRLVNQGALDVHGATAFNDSVTGLTNAAGATLRVQGDAASGTSTLTIAKSFTNNGAIVLTDTTSSYGSALNTPSGAKLTNGSSGTIEAAVGTGGTRTVGAELDNQGTLTLNRPLTINEAGAAHTNSGTIDVSGGDLTLIQTGTTPSFTTSGTIMIGAGQTFTVNGGALNYNAGTIGGSGTLAINGSAVTATQDFSTATTALTLTTGTWDGSGKLTVAASTLLRVRSSTINARLVNQGALDVHGASAFNDSVTNASGGTLRIQGDAASGTSTLTILNSFANNGTIVLTDTTSSYGAVLNVTNGTLTNAVGATIRTDTGTAGTRTINARLDNEGTLTVLRALTFNKASAAHVNRGTIDVHDKLTIAQSGTTPSFTQLGTLTIGSGDTVAVTSGSFVYDSGTISGGRLTLASVSVSAAHDFSTVSTALSMAGTTWGGSGTLTVAPSTGLVLAGSTINAPFVNQGAVTVGGTSTLSGSVTNAAGATLRVQGNGGNGTGTLTIATGFSNDGTIALTDTTSSYGAVLNVTAGTLVNAVSGTIRADTGTGGSRTLNALFDNHGSFIVATDAAQTTTLTKASAAHQNSGTWTVASGTLAIAGAGASFANLAGGTVQGAGIFRVVGVAFTNAGGINPGTAGTGILKIVGNYTQAAGGALNIELGGTTPGTQYDRLADSAGTVALSGALNVTLVNGFTPALGDTFTVLTFPSRAGTLPTLNGLLLGGGVQLDTVWTATSLRLVAVLLQTAHAGDITANETWTAVTSPHIVSGYLKIRNGATLTIEDGATVKFDAATGLQVGDSGTGEAGGLVMLGTPGSIHLTANTGSPVPGFWKGLEVQKTSGPLLWRNVDIEYAGGTRSSPIDESCVLLIDPAAVIDLDSVHIRQCVHAGIHHFAGNVHVHRSEIDSVTGAGIQSFAGVLRLDSTAIRGVGQMALIFGNGSVDLAGATANKFTGNAGGSIQMFGHQLPGLGRQDSIAGNGLGAGIGDTIVVDSGTVGAGVPAFTIFRQPAPYLVTGFLSIWSPTGVNVSLDTGLVMAFDTAAALSVGDFSDSTGASSGNSGNFVSLGTAANPVVLRNRLGRPGWQGLFLGAQSGTPVVRHLRLARGGYQPDLGQVCQNCLVKTTGFFEPLNTNLYVDAPTGTAPFVIDSVVSDSSHLYGIVVKRSPPQGAQVRDNSINHAASAGLVWRASFNPNDDISGNTLVGNHYAVDVVADVLPKVPANTLSGNVTDTLLLHGGTVPVTQTLPQLGFRWRVTQAVVVDSGAVFSVLPGDTVTFDPAGSLTIGGAIPSALNAAGTVGAPIVFTVTPGQDHWLGLEFANLSGSTVSHVLVEHAGGTIACGFIDCQAIVLGAVRYSNASTFPLTLESVTIRHARTMAINVDSSAASPLLVQNSQFYDNPFSPMIKSPNPLLLSIHTSDLYHYRGQVIQSANAGTDSLDALGNWWGDAAGLEKGFEFNDSLGRGSLWFNAVRFDVVSGPFSPRGPAAQLVPATDTVLANGGAINAIVGDPDSIRVRVLDAEGRGVSGTAIVWGTSSGSFQHPGLPTDEGGRAGGVWLTTTAANLQFVQATVAGLAGSPVTWPAFLQPGPTVSVDFQLLQSLSAGVVSADSNSVAFTSSLRPAALVTNARDQYGNPTAPQTGFFFTDLPTNTGFQNYGLIDSVKFDTVFFHPTVSTPSTFQLHGNFLDSTGTIQDSVLISMLPVAAGMRLIVDSFDFHSLCPVGGPYNVLCRQTLLAFLVDSAGSPLPPDPAYQFTWTNSNPASVSDSTYGPMNEFVDIAAHANGTADVIVQQLSGPPLVPDRDTLRVTVDQVLANIAVTPDTISVGLGDTVTFSATATDQGGSPMPGTVGWRQDGPAGQYLTIIDYPSANSIRVRIDSAYPGFPSDYAAITAFTERGPGDTLLAAGVMYNPIIRTLTGFSSQPWAVDIDPRTNRAYVADRGSANVAVVDVATNSIVTFQTVGSQPEHVKVDSRNARVYVSNVAMGTLSVLDASADGAPLAMIEVGPNPSFVGLDTSSNRVYVAAVCADPQSGCSIGGSFLLTIDGTGPSMIPQDTVRLPANGSGVVYDEVNRLVYVAMSNDTVAMVDPATHTVVGLIGVGTAPKGMAINPVTRKLYVTNSGANSVSVIDLTTNLVVKTEFLFSNAPERVAVDPIINRIYVAGYGNFLLDQIDGNTDTNIGYRSVNCSYPNDVAINPQNRDLLMPCWSDVRLLTYRFLTP
jgi:YVTN family beta-propeller protein